METIQCANHYTNTTVLLKKYILRTLLSEVYAGSFSVSIIDVLLSYCKSGTYLTGNDNA